MSSRKRSAATKRPAASVQNGTEVPAKKKAGAPAKPRKPRGMIKLNEGEVISDLDKKKWRVGDLMSWGGFGAIHYASRDTTSAVDSRATFVVKIEPHSNGPLFVELSFYVRVAKPVLMESWKKEKGVKHVGIPPYIASGSLDKDGKKFRFMVMERFGEDIDALFRKNNKQFAMGTVLQLGLRIVDCLWYIHSQGFVHADIKGSNLMLGYGKSKQSEVYLVDYGLAFRFDRDGGHKEYKEDPRKRHDGTIEFTSRDAHKGVEPSRRADLEILGYCLVQWACGELPWEDNLADKEYVQAEKTRHMNNIPKFVRDCMKGAPADELVEYLNIVTKLEYEEVPNYKAIKEIFTKGLRKRGIKDNGTTVNFVQSDRALSSSSTASEASPSPVKNLKRTAKVKEADVPKKKSKPSPARKTAPKKTTTPKRKPRQPQRQGRPKTVDTAQSP